VKNARLLELAAVTAAATALAIALTWPMAFELGSVGRVDNGDGQFSIWNVAWVARALIADPLHVFDANIFYPHKDALAFSENNLGAGALAVPVYWLTRNPFAAHNSVFLLSMVLSAAGMYYLVRHLTGDRGGAAVSAIGYAFCPFVFAHTAHIQLLMTAGLPICMLAMHRLADRPTPGRGAALGAAMAGEALCCGYYGVYVVLLVGYATVVLATARRLWGSRAFWLAIAVSAIVAIGLVLPAFAPYVRLQRVDGFRRALDEARLYSSNWSDYFASSSYAHVWMLRYLPRWIDVGFPGFVVLVFAMAGVWVSRTRHRGELIALYGGLAVLACWASFGPPGGLYTLLYNALPFFAWLRVPARFVLVVTFALSVLAGIGVSAFTGRVRRPAVIATAIALAAAAELRVPSNMRPVEPFAPVYRTLARLPRGPVIECPFFYLPEMFPMHVRYMLASTTHWNPLVNGYSDYIPPDFVQNVMTLAPFPTRPALKLLEPHKVRYAVFHMNGYVPENQRDVLARLKDLEDYLRPLYIDVSTRLYEIVGYPK